MTDQPKLARMRDQDPRGVKRDFSYSGSTPRSDWHKSMFVKFERAARYPWLPVSSDPPSPQ